LFLALGRYNGSRGQAPYPNMVMAARRHWEYTEPPVATASAR
ncbi:MAG: lytic transglycosylase domain-containing protein, partial [Sphaerotilus sp.]